MRDVWQTFISLRASSPNVNAISTSYAPHTIFLERLTYDDLTLRKDSARQT